MCRDKHFEGYDAATVVEVIEHLDPPRLAAFERVLFESARPKTVVVTTSNTEYTVKFDTLPAGQFRHKTISSSGRGNNFRTGPGEWLSASDTTFVFCRWAKKILQ